MHHFVTLSHFAYGSCQKLAKSFKMYAKCDCINFCKLTELNIGLAASVAMRFRGRGADQEGLVQVGSSGLLKAIRDRVVDALHR